MKLGTHTTTTRRQFSIGELKEATRNFDLSTYIGEGSIGKVPFSHSKCCLKDYYNFLQKLQGLKSLSKLHHSYGQTKSNYFCFVRRSSDFICILVDIENFCQAHFVCSL